MKSSKPLGLIPERDKPLMIPEVTVCCRPKGLPIATTKSPTSDLAESPSATCARPPALPLRTATAGTPTCSGAHCSVARVCQRLAASQLQAPRARARPAGSGETQVSFPGNSSPRASPLGFRSSRKQAAGEAGSAMKALPADPDRIFRVSGSLHGDAPRLLLRALPDGDLQHPVHVACLDRLGIRALGKRETAQERGRGAPDAPV